MHMPRRKGVVRALNASVPEKFCASAAQRFLHSHRRAEDAVECITHRVSEGCDATLGA